MLSSIPKVDVAHSAVGGRSPSVPEALLRLKTAIRDAKSLGDSVIKIIHGYGSSGVGGGAIKLAIHKELATQKAKGHILLYIPGEKWSILDSAIDPLRAEFDVIDDKELGVANPGMTVIWIKKLKKKRARKRRTLPSPASLFPELTSAPTTPSPPIEETVSTPAGSPEEAPLEVAPSEPPISTDLPVPIIVELPRQADTAEEQHETLPSPMEDAPLPGPVEPPVEVAPEVLPSEIMRREETLPVVIEEGKDKVPDSPPWWEELPPEDEEVSHPPVSPAPTPPPTPRPVPKSKRRRVPVHPPPQKAGLSKEDKWLLLITALMLVPFLGGLLFIVLRQVFSP